MLPPQPPTVQFVSVKTKTKVHDKKYDSEVTLLTLRVFTFTSNKLCRNCGILLYMPHKRATSSTLMRHKTPSKLKISALTS